MARGTRDADPEAADELREVAAADPADPHAIDPHAILLPDDDEPDEDEGRALGNCGACGEPVYELEPNAWEGGEVFHAHHSKTRQIHEKGVRKAKRRYERSATAKKRAAQAQEV